MSQEIDQAEVHWTDFDFKGFAPHNGREGFQETSGPHKGYGGQVLLIRKALEAKEVCSWSCGRRFGKTLALILLGLEEQARTKGYYRRGIVSKDHTKAIEMFEFFLKSLGHLVKKSHSDKGQNRWIEIIPLSVTEERTDGTTYTYTVNEGGKLWFWSGESSDGLQGFMFPFNRIDVDEMQLQSPTMVTKTFGPMLTDIEGKMVICGHPSMGKQGHFLFQEWFSYGESDDPKWAGYESVNAPSEANPFITMEGHAAGRRKCSTPQEEKEEYDAVFVGSGGGVFPKLDKVFVIDPLELEKHESLEAFMNGLFKDAPLPNAKFWFGEEPDPLHSYALGGDWAVSEQAGADYTVCTIMNLVTNRQAACFRVNGAPIDEQLPWVHAFRKFYNNAQIHGDGNGLGRAASEPLARAYGDGYTDHGFRGENKVLYVQRTARAFNQERVKLLKIPEQRLEFSLYTLVPKKRLDDYGGSSTVMRYGHPPNRHDDFCDALMMLSDYLAIQPMKPKKKPAERPGPGSIDWERRWFRKMRKRSRGRRKIG